MWLIRSSTLLKDAPFGDFPPRIENHILISLRWTASMLIGQLVRIARESGLTRLEADVLAHNGAMLSVFTGGSLPMTQRREGQVVHVTLSLRANPV
jgi:hypothetical protein